MIIDSFGFSWSVDLVLGLGGNKTVTVLFSSCEARSLQLVLAVWVPWPAGASYSGQVRAFKGGGGARCLAGRCRSLHDHTHTCHPPDMTSWRTR